MNRAVREARLKGMCEENFMSLKECGDKISAIELYKRTIDWALECGYPSLDLLRKEFGHYEAEGLYVDGKLHGDLLNRLQCYVFHNCTGTVVADLNIEKKIIPMLYVANGCHLTFKGSGMEHFSTIVIPIYVFGENNVCTENDENVEFRIFNF